ncbi:MAG: hypothetical protein ACRDN9_21330 [Streptosporangiaceae bacterium]
MTRRHLARRLWKPGALALTAATVVLTTAGPASADVSHRPLTRGATRASALELQLRAPMSLGPLGDHADLSLADARGTTKHTNACKALPEKTAADAHIASGTGVTEAAAGQTPFAALDRSAHADLSQPGPSSDAYGTIPDNPLLSGAFGPVHAVVHKKAGDSGSSAEIVHLEIGPLGGQLPSGQAAKLTKQLKGAAGQLQGALEDATGDSSPVEQVLSKVIRQSPGGSAGQQARGLKQGLSSLQGRLPSFLDQLPHVSLLELDGLRAVQTIKHVKGGVRATADSRLESLGLLGGIVQLDGFKAHSKAFANGRPGGAHAVSSPETFHLSIGGLDAVLDSSGLHLPALDALPARARSQLEAQLEPVLANVLNMLSQGGLRVSPAAHRTDAAKDGTSAIAEGAGLLVSFQPPGSSKPALALTLGKGIASVAAKMGTCQQVAPPKQPPSHERPPTLAYTGPRVPYPTLLGAGLLGVAALIGCSLLLRRRRSVRG